VRSIAFPTPPEQLVELRCRGCLRSIGFARQGVWAYHSLQCADDYDPGLFEDRDALLVTLIQHENVPATELGRIFGLSRQRVNQIWAERRKVLSS
jgi:hypothetical protein